MARVACQGLASVGEGAQCAWRATYERLAIDSLWFGVQGLGFGLKGAGFRFLMQILQCKVMGLALGLRVWSSSSMFHIS